VRDKVMYKNALPAIGAIHDRERSGDHEEVAPLPVATHRSQPIE
jgi:hypothetical protein